VKPGDEALGFSPPPIEADPTRLQSIADLLRARLDRLQDLDGAALREEWRRLRRSEPPRISRDLLLRAIAYRLQEVEYGGLPRWAEQTLVGSANIAGPSVLNELAPKPSEPRLKPGMRFVREWRGRTHIVLVRDNDFAFEGRPYRSLTQIAREITGAHWSGPRFFGLGRGSGESALGSALALPFGCAGASGILTEEVVEKSSQAPRKTAKTDKPGVSLPLSTCESDS
jgi:hypothetical protein